MEPYKLKFHHGFYSPVQIRQPEESWGAVHLSVQQIVEAPDDVRRASLIGR
jgi:hypothetical protein